MGVPSTPPNRHGATEEAYDEPRTTVTASAAEAGEDLPFDDDASSAPSTAIEPDFSTDDEGYEASIATSYVTSIASDIRKGVEENGRVYAAYGVHKPWIPVDDLEVSSPFARPCAPWTLPATLLTCPTLAGPQ